MVLAGLRRRAGAGPPLDGEQWIIPDAWEQLLPLVSPWLALAVFVPAVVVMLAGGIAWHDGLWGAPAAPLGIATAVSAVVVGVGLTITDRPSRR